MMRSDNSQGHVSSALVSAGFCAKGLHFDMSDRQPYRLTAAILAGDEEKQRVYGKDSAGQERYLGYVISRDGEYFASGLPTGGAITRTFDSAEEATRAIYEKCMDTGYLVKEHPNYLQDFR